MAKSQSSAKMLTASFADQVSWRSAVLFRISETPKDTGATLPVTKGAPKNPRDKLQAHHPGGLP